MQKSIVNSICVFLVVGSLLPDLVQTIPAPSDKYVTIIIPVKMGGGKSQTENSVPPFRALRKRLICRPAKGLIHRKDGCPPKTDLIPSQRSLRSQVGFSLFNRSISVSSLHIE